MKTRGLKKSTVWWAGFIVLALLGLVAIIQRTESVAQTIVYSIVWLVGIGLGAQVLDTTVKSVWYRPEMDKDKEKEKECGTT